MRSPPIFSVLLITLLFGLTPVIWTAEETGADLEAKGIASLKRSQTESTRLISAANFFARAAESYKTAGNSAKSSDMNPLLYWCKKKMSPQQVSAFLEAEAVTPAIADRFDQIDKNPPAQTEAKAFFDRAEAFAKAQPDQHLLIAVRFFEVADRFKGSDVGLQAQQRHVAALKMAAETVAEAAAEKLDLTGKLNPPVPVAIKTPVPTSVQQKASEKTVRDFFKAEFARTAPQEKLLLAKKLRQLSTEPSGDAAVRYVYLNLAIRLAAEAGDFELTHSLFDELSRTFDGNFNAQIKSTMSLIMSSTIDPTNSRLALAYKTMIDTPQDPPSIAIFGRFLVFKKGDWPRGLEALSRGNDARFKSLAQRELKGGATPEELVELAELWLNLTSKVEAHEAVAITTHARLLYSQALPKLSGIARLKVEKQLAANKTIVDLIKRTKPEIDAVAGRWEIQNGLLSSDSSDWARLQFPYVPPEEYDYKIVFEVKAEKSVLFQVLAHKGVAWVWLLAGDARISAIDMVDGKAWHSGNPTTTPLELKLNQVYTSVVKVRKDSVKAYLDDKLLADLKVDYKRLDCFKDYRMRNNEAIGVGASTVKIKTAEVEEITGVGKDLR